MPCLRRSALLLVVAVGLAGCGEDDVIGAPPRGEGPRGRIEAGGEADEGIDGVEAYRVESNEHTPGVVTYDVVPPPGGPHNPAWANCGFYDEPIPDEHLVHDLEHGAVWLAYDPDLPASDLERLQQLTRANPKVIATPYPDLPDQTAVVASAWARQLVLDAVDDPRLEEFVVAYQDGSQAPESGVTCVGSPVGDPIP